MATFQALVAPSLSSAANYLAWAQALGRGFSTAGWAPQTGHGEVVATGTGGSYTWSNVVAASTTRHLPAAAYTFRGAFVGGTTYTGISTTANVANVDLVTFGGLTYAHLTSSSSSATTPDLDPTNWAVFNYEIWKSTGATSGTLPIYVRFVYCANSNATPFPNIHIAMGTGIDVNGNITTNPVVLQSSSPTTNFPTANGTQFVGSLTLGEIDVSGDADNIRFILWRGTTAQSGSENNVFIIDRAKTATGGDSDAFIYFATSNLQNGEAGGAWSCRCAIVAKPTFGGGTVASSTVWLGLPIIASGVTTFGTTPPYPVFPPFGWLGNPLLGMACFDPTFVADGTLQYGWAYGASHPYLINNNNQATAARNPTSFANNACIGIRWE